MLYPKRHPGTGFQPDRLKAKRDQLIGILSSKMKAQLGVVEPSKDQRIRQEIELLFKTTATPIEADLKNLERKLRQEFTGERSMINSRMQSASQSNLLKATAEKTLGTSHSVRSGIGITNLKSGAALSGSLSNVRRSLGTEEEYWA